MEQYDSSAGGDSQPLRRRLPLGSSTAHHQKLRHLPRLPGVYIFKNKTIVVYVGKAVDLQARVRSYFNRSAQKDPKVRAIAEQTQAVEYIIVRSEIEALLLETTLIARYRPRWNVIIRDEHSRIYLKITTKDNLPTVTIVRHEPDEKGILRLGPFPTTTAVRTVLSRMRKIFPFYTRRHDTTRRCLHCHLGLCPGPTATVDRRLYRRSIANLTVFLSGKTASTVRRITSEMRAAAKREDFIEAAALRRQLTAIAEVTQPIRHPELYIERPTLVEVEREAALKNLQRLLGLPSLPRRIEGYDIAHVAGKEAVGSLVVLTNGLPDTDAYRRFRIRGNKTNDDLAMIQEVLERRLSHPEWSLPHLFVIDGGRGQVNTAIAVLKKRRIQRRVIGLAKRFERVVTEGEELALPKHHPALLLLQVLRDEAHRFAQHYHHLLRRKKLLTAI